MDFKDYKHTQLSYLTSLDVLDSQLQLTRYRVIMIHSDQNINSKDQNGRQQQYARIQENYESNNFQVQKDLKISNSTLNQSFDLQIQQIIKCNSNQEAQKNFAFIINRSRDSITLINKQKIPAKLLLLGGSTLHNDCKNVLIDYQEEQTQLRQYLVDPNEKIQINKDFSESGDSLPFLEPSVIEKQQVEEKLAVKTLKEEKLEELFVSSDQYDKQKIWSAYIHLSPRLLSQFFFFLPFMLSTGWILNLYYFNQEQKKQYISHGFQNIYLQSIPYFYPLTLIILFLSGQFTQILIYNKFKNGLNSKWNHSNKFRPLFACIYIIAIITQLATYFGIFIVQKLYQICSCPIQEINIPQAQYQGSYYTRQYNCFTFKYELQQQLQQPPYQYKLYSIVISAKYLQDHQILLIVLLILQIFISFFIFLFEYLQLDIYRQKWNTIIFKEQKIAEITYDILAIVLIILCFGIQADVETTSNPEGIMLITVLIFIISVILIFSIIVFITRLPKDPPIFWFIQQEQQLQQQFDMQNIYSQYKNNDIVVKEQQFYINDQQKFKQESRKQLIRFEYLFKRLFFLQVPIQLITAFIYYIYYDISYRFFIYSESYLFISVIGIIAILSFVLVIASKLKNVTNNIVSNCLQKLTSQSYKIGLLFIYQIYSVVISILLLISNNYQVSNSLFLSLASLYFALFLIVYFIYIGSQSRLEYFNEFNLQGRLLECLFTSGILIGLNLFIPTLWHDSIMSIFNISLQALALILSIAYIILDIKITELDNQIKEILKEIQQTDILYLIPKDMQSSVNKNINQSEIMINIEFINRNFKIIKQLGIGSKGKVDYCENTLTGQKFAVKSVLCNSNEDRENALQELKLLSKCQKYPSIINVYGYSERKIDDSGRQDFILILEYVEKSLQEIIDDLKKKQLTFTKLQLYQFLKQIIVTMSQLNENEQIAHRDIKPSNILVKNWGTEDPQFLLADFGEAKKYQLSTVVQTTVVCVGTLNYMSPELKNAYQKAQNDEEQFHYDAFNYFVSDVFSLGVVTYQMMTMKNIRLMNQKQEVLEQNLKDMDEYEEKFGAEMVGIVKLMLKWNPLVRVNFSVLKGYIEKFQNPTENDLSL